MKGEFSIVVFDQNKNKLILGRDRIGKKPLYWFQNAHFFIFASELKAILATGAVPQTPALDAISSYLYFGFIPQDMSPINGINKLLPAHYLQFSFDGSKTIDSYWSYSECFKLQHPLPLNEIVNELDAIIKDNLSESLSNTEKIGCLLSGDLASASLLNYATQITPKENITAYSVGFSGEDNEDLGVAKSVAAALGVNQEIFTITQKNFLDDLVKIIWHLDEPLADPYIFSTWRITALAANESTKLLSGIGSDELFSSFGHYASKKQGDFIFQKTMRLIVKGAQKALIPLFNSIYKPLAIRLLKRSRSNFQYENYLKQIALMTKSDIDKASPHLEGIFDPQVFFYKFYHLKRISSRAASYLYFDIKTYLPDSQLLQFDRMAAAHSLEWQTPFLDKRLVEFLAGLPDPKYLKQKDAAFYLKALLRGVFPDSFIDRERETKRKFLKKWLVREEMKGIFKLLVNGSLSEAGILSKDWLVERVTRIEIDPFAFKHLWAALVLEIWFRLYISQPIALRPPAFTVKQFIG